MLIFNEPKENLYRAEDSNPFFLQLEFSPDALTSNQIKISFFFLVLHISIQYITQHTIHWFILKIEATYFYYTFLNFQKSLDYMYIKTVECKFHEKY